MLRKIIRGTLHFPWPPFLGYQQRQKDNARSVAMGMPTAEKFLLSSGSGVKLQSEPLRWEVPQVTDTVR